MEQTNQAKRAPDPRFSDNAKLIELAQNGDMEACEKLVLQNAGLVRSIALRFCGRGTDAEDLIQIGNIGMLKAIRSYDPSRGCVFSTFAVPLILGEIRRFLRDDGLIKVYRPQRKLGAYLMRTREQLMQKNGKEPGISELAKACGVDPEEAAAALASASAVCSLSDPISSEDGNLTLAQTLTDDETSEKEFDRLVLSQEIEHLPTEWKKIVLLRYFRDYSQQKTAEMLGLTQVKVSREEKKIVEHLRARLSM
jgi:RNA polymerase sporulation-specific sigma factor